MKNPSIRFGGEVIVDIFWQGRMDSMLMRNIEALSESYRFMDALTRRVTRCQLLISPMKVHVKRYMKTIGEEDRLAQRLQQWSLEITYQPRRQPAKVEAGIFTPYSGTIRDRF